MMKSKLLQIALLLTICTSFTNTQAFSWEKTKKAITIKNTKKIVKAASYATLGIITARLGLTCSCLALFKLPNDTTLEPDTKTLDSFLILDIDGKLKRILDKSIAKWKQKRIITIDIFKNISLTTIAITSACLFYTSYRMLRKAYKVFKNKKIEKDNKEKE